MKKVLAIDIGASSGRFILISYNDGTFESEEIYRFKNGMKSINGHLSWDFRDLMSNIYNGINVTLLKHKDILSIGIDTWGVDYGLLDENDYLYKNPIGYRDSRCNESANELLKNVDYSYIYKRSGIQYLNFNTIFQLYDDIKKNEKFNSFLLIPDLINFLLTGKKYIELTNLSTTAFYNPISKTIDKDLINLIGLKDDKIPEIIYPSKKVGSLKKELIYDFRLYDVDIVSVGSHDTASAVASLNLKENVAFINSGTWSLLGVELDEPIINEESYKFNFTNEVGLEHKIRFLKNIMGLFIIQELKNDLAKFDGEVSFATLHKEAQEVENNETYIDVNDELFATPGDMLNKYAEYLKKTNQFGQVATRGEVIRSIYESMAFKYKIEFEKLKKITNRNIDTIIVCGGGANATLLNQLIADVLDIEVVTGLSEATIFGNALSQLIYLKEFNSLSEGRAILDKNTAKVHYFPKNIEKYKQKFNKYLSVTGDKIL